MSDDTGSLMKADMFEHSNFQSTVNMLDNDTVQHGHFFKITDNRYRHCLSVRVR